MQHEQQIEVAGGQVLVSYSDTEGVKSDVPAIAIDGWGLEGTFDEVAESLDRDGFRVITFVQPDVNTEPADIHYEDKLLIVGGLAKTLGLQRFGLIGHSNGGGLATDYAWRYPGQVIGLADIVGSHDPRDSYLTGLAASKTEEEFVAGGYQELLDFLGQFDNDGMRSYRDRVTGFNEKQLAAYHRAAVETVARVHQGHHGTLKQLFEYSGYKTYIHGEHDKESYLNEIKNHARIEVTEIADSGHFPNIDNPQGLYLALKNFMQTIQQRV